MKFALILAVASALVLAGCGQKPAGEAAAPKPSAAKSAVPLPTGPVLSGVGTVAAVEGKTVTLDHEAVQGGLAAGRHAFVADAAVLAEAPLEPGSRVAFSYQDWPPQGVLLTELKAR
jgi:hypothetical protein